MKPRFALFAAARPIGLAILLPIALMACEQPGPRDGYAVLDRSVYADARKDAQGVAEVVRRSETPPPSRSPNIVVILADDLGYGDLGAYGNTLLRTPNLDALAKGGARFTDFYASDSSCSASRTGLLTGRYALRAGINFPILAANASLVERLLRPIGRLSAGLGMTDMVEVLPPAVDGLPASEITLPEALRIAGYATGMVGKWHLGDFSALPQYNPRQHGFDSFAGFPHSNDLFPYPYWKNEAEVDPNVGLLQENVTTMLTREAIAFIDAHREGPFFLYFAHKNVHTPLFPPPELAGRSPAGPYGDSVEELDASVGELMRALAERGLLENTLVFFTSDNGPWHFGSPGALRGRKGQAMEGGQRVPAIAHWPGHVPAGGVVSAPAMNIDLFPTLLALAGLGLPADRTIDGRDIGALLFGRATASPHEALFFFNANVIDGVRSGRWKYYRHLHSYTWPVPLDKVSTLAGRFAHANTYTDSRNGVTVGRSTHDPLLFDVGADTNESYDVLPRHPDEAARLRTAIEAWERDFFANPRGWK